MAFFFSGTFCTSARTTKYAIILFLIATNSFEYFTRYADKSRAFDINAYTLKIALIKEPNPQDCQNFKFFEICKYAASPPDGFKF